ncbi:stalk domain-containing protein [Paenibacillus sp. YYML68]|uniref:stalk domain-containing protein n=1 Tax=Paenibacillus sp. YYML68 TaxID=2909250 RepID=UPI0024917F6C|nr:stalk domain-containing protein [Paenibacillus sp. YYML68]
MHTSVKKMLLAALLVLPAALYSPSGTYAAVQTDIKVQINDKLVQFQDAKPVVVDNSKLQVPARTIVDELGYSLEWQMDGQQITVTIQNEETSLTLTTGEKVISVNEQTTEVESAPRLVDGRVYVPFRLISDTFGATTQWDATNRIAILGTDGRYYAPAWYRPLINNRTFTKVIKAKASAYTATPLENGGYAALDYMGNTLSLGTVAVDPSVIPLGSQVYIEGYTHEGLPVGGMFGTATDTGGAIKGNKVDIFVPQSRDQAWRFGIQDVKVYVLAP